MANTYGFDEAGARRVVRAVRAVESHRDAPPVRPPVVHPHGPEVQWVRVTSTTLVGGRYPGKLLDFHDGGASPTFTDLADVWVVPANGETLATGTRYLARVSDFADDRLVLATGPLGATGPAGPPGTGVTPSGVRVYNDNIQTLAGDFYVVFNQTDYDTDSYWSSGTPNQLTIPAAGFYTLGAYVEFAPATGATVTNVTLYLQIVRSGVSVYPAKTQEYRDPATGPSVTARLSVATSYLMAAADIVRAVVVPTYGTGSTGGIKDLNKDHPCLWATRVS